MIPKVGIYEDVPFKEYLEWEAFSNSGVKYLLKSAAHYKHWKDNPDQTDAQRIGSLIDCLVLTPKDFGKGFALTPKTYMNSKDKEMPWTLQSNTCKDTVKAIQKAGKVAISQFEYDEANLVRKAVYDHPIASELLTGGRQQVSVVWEDPDHGVLCKGRYDNVREGGIDDLKSTVDASPDSFSYTINKFGYHIQGALYSDAFDTLKVGSSYPPEYNLIAVEKKSPYVVGCYSLEPSTILTGRALYKRAMITYKLAKEADRWDGYSNFLEPLDIPKYFIDKELTDEVLNA